MYTVISNFGVTIPLTLRVLGYVLFVAFYCNTFTSLRRMNSSYGNLFYLLLFSTSFEFTPCPNHLYSNVKLKAVHFSPIAESKTLALLLLCHCKIPAGCFYLFYHPPACISGVKHCNIRLSYQPCEKWYSISFSLVA